MFVTYTYLNVSLCTLPRLYTSSVAVPMHDHVSGPCQCAFPYSWPRQCPCLSSYPWSCAWTCPFPLSYQCPCLCPCMCPWSGPWPYIWACHCPCGRCMSFVAMSMHDRVGDDVHFHVRDQTDHVSVCCHGRIHGHVRVCCRFRGHTCGHVSIRHLARVHDRVHVSSLC